VGYIKGAIKIHCLQDDGEDSNGYNLFRNIPSNHQVDLIVRVYVVKVKNAVHCEAMVWPLQHSGHFTPASRLPGAYMQNGSTEPFLANSLYMHVRTWGNS
jgi:hypothetical protein